MFTPASKKEAKLRLALTGLSGGGKTWTSLSIATAFGGKVAVVDTERKSASKYADQFKFDVLDMEPPFHPQKYIEAIHAAEEMGYTTVILDSMSHAWTGKGGIISIVDDIAAHSKSQSSFFAWQEGTRLQNDLLDAITNCKIHIIGTIRTKQEYVIEKDKDGKAKPTRVGMKPIQRDGFEYEFDMVFSMDLENRATVTKTRCKNLPMGLVLPKPGANVAKTLMQWLHGVEWIEAKSERAVAFACEQWRVEREAAAQKIAQAVESDALSSFLPKDEFKEWVVGV